MVSGTRTIGIETTISPDALNAQGSNASSEEKQRLDTTQWQYQSKKMPNDA
jgi:hypothetical protein